MLRSHSAFLALCLLLSGLVIASTARSATITHGPIVGAAAPDRVRIWLRTDVTASVALTVTPAGGPGVQVVGSTAPSEDPIAVLEVGGLVPGSPYSYALSVESQPAFAGTFRTPPAAEPGATLRFAFAADLKTEYQPYTQFDALLGTAPDLVILGGDNIYADEPNTVANTADGYARRYRETWSDPALRGALQVLPTLMTWDDHELINNWYPGRDGRYPAARAAYDAYQGSHNPDPVVPGELYYAFSSGPADFFVLDTRSHRSPNPMSDGPGKSMLGDLQRAALLDWLSESSATFKIIVSSVPFHPFGSSDDGWAGPRGSGFRHERRTIFDYIRSNRIPGVVLLSGDRHWAGVFALGYPDDTDHFLYEFMPTPIGASLGRVQGGNDPRVLLADDEVRGFGLFELDDSVRPATLLYQWRSGDEVVHEILLDETNLIPEPSAGLLQLAALLTITAVREGRRRAADRESGLA